MKITNRESTAYHHQTVGSVERNHRELNKYIRLYLQDWPEWDTCAWYFTSYYNIEKHGSNDFKYSPFELVFGRQILLLHEILTGKREPIYNIDHFVSELKQKLAMAHEKTVKIIEKLKYRNKAYYDKRTNPINIKIGDVVYLNREPYNKHETLKKKYLVISLDENDNVTISNARRTHKVHKNRLVI